LKFDIASITSVSLVKNVRCQAQQTMLS